MDHLQHVFQGERLEVQAIGGVVVGGHGLRIAVDHDGLVAVLAHGQRRVHAAVVELDALADAVRSATQHHDLVALGRLCLALLLVGGVHIGGGGGELRGAGVDTLVHRTHAELVAPVAQHALAHADQMGQTAIGEALALELVHDRLVQAVDALGTHLFFQRDQFLDLHQEPGVDLGQTVHLLHAHAGAEGIAHVPQALGARHAQLLAQAVHGVLRRGIENFIETILAGFQTTQCLLQRFLEGAADGHHLAHRFHLGGQTRIGLGEFLEGETRHLGDHVVDGRLERGRGGAAGDVVLQFVQGVPHGQLGRHLGDGEAGGLGGQGGGTRHARIHLDDDHAAVFRIDGELHVGTAGVDADLAQHRQRGVAHDPGIPCRSGSAPGRR